MNTYIFHREHDGKPFWYPVELKDDDDAVRNAHHNRGTLKVTTPDGRVVFDANET